MGAEKKIQGDDFEIHPSIGPFLTVKGSRCARGNEGRRKKTGKEDLGGLGRAHNS